jgi:threonine dehydrogenase-like Zn-dependent dehydrogenase
LGISAIQLARAFGALEVFAVDIDPEKLKIAEKYGAVAVNAREADPVEQIRALTGGRGVSAALELIGLPLTMRQAVQSLAYMGRAVIAGISDLPLELETYHEVLGKEAEIIGSNDHLLQELPVLIEMARRGKLDLTDAVTGIVPLEADAINEALDRLEHFGSGFRTVIAP